MTLSKFEKNSTNNNANSSSFNNTVSENAKNENASNHQHTNNSNAETSTTINFNNTTEAKSNNLLDNDKPDDNVVKEPVKKITDEKNINDNTINVVIYDAEKDNTALINVENNVEDKNDAKNAIKILKLIFHIANKVHHVSI